MRKRKKKRRSHLWPKLDRSAMDGTKRSVDLTHPARKDLDVSSLESQLQWVKKTSALPQQSEGKNEARSSLQLLEWFRKKKRSFLKKMKKKPKKPHNRQLNNRRLKRSVLRRSVGALTPTLYSVLKYPTHPAPGCQWETFRTPSKKLASSGEVKPSDG